MNQRILNRCAEIAIALKPKCVTGKAFHITAFVKKSKIVTVGVNNYTKGHPHKRFGKYLNHKGFEKEYVPCLHSEISALLKYGEEDISDIEVVNIRIGANDQLRLSRPCPNCLSVLQTQVNARSIFYSDNDGGFQQIS